MLTLHALWNLQARNVDVLRGSVPEPVWLEGLLPLRRLRVEVLVVEVLSALLGRLEGDLAPLVLRWVGHVDDGLALLFNDAIRYVLVGDM